jgi:TolB-like protein/class 3 adenylate cyclase/rhodanese-related sulfurtransferase
MDRKLAVILALDVVGYTGQMARDESGTHERLRTARREIVEPAVRARSGTIFKLTGDGLLAEFGSVADALGAAAAIQQGLSKRNGTEPPESRIVVRIGINLGEVIIEDGDRYGDGVNIAARLQERAEPGGICVSAKVAREVTGKLPYLLRPLGAQKLKNVAEPVEIFAVALDGVAGPAAAAAPARRRVRPALLVAAAAAAVIAVIAAFGVGSGLLDAGRSSLAPPGKPSLAVLPFDDFGDGSDSYFADGMTEDLITDLSKLSGIFVIARNSSWAYKDRAVDVQEVGRELGVRYVLEGSVRRSGDDVRINAQLIDAASGTHLWADRYDGDLEDVFELQDKVIGEIVRALEIELTGQDRALVAAVETESPEAYDLLLRGWQHYRRDTEAETQTAIALFEQAIAADPDYGRAHAALAAANWRVARSSWEAASQGGFVHSFDAAKRYLLHPGARGVSLARAISAEILTQEGRYDEAMAEIAEALRLGPNDPDVLVSKARILNASGRAAEAEAAIREAMRIDPLYAPDMLRVLAISLFHQERYEEALAAMEQVVQRESDVADDYATIVAALGHLGRTEGVAAGINAFDNLTVPAGYSPMTVQEQGRFWWYGDIFDYHAPYLAKLEEGLLKAGVPPGAAFTADAPYRRLMRRSFGEYSVEGARKIDLETARRMREAGIAFVDVRAPVDFDRGHIPGAVNLHLQLALTPESLEAVAGRDEEVVFSCHGKYCADSAIASAKALVWGWSRVYYFAAGYPGWKDAGFPVETTPQP